MGTRDGAMVLWEDELAHGAVPWGPWKKEEKPGKMGGNISWGDTGDVVHLRLLRNKGFRDIQTEEEDVGVSSGEGLGRRL